MFIHILTYLTIEIANLQLDDVTAKIEQIFLLLIWLDIVNSIIILFTISRQICFNKPHT